MKGFGHMANMAKEIPQVPSLKWCGGNPILDHELFHISRILTFCVSVLSKYDQDFIPVMSMFMLYIEIPVPSLKVSVWIMKLRPNGIG